MGQDPETCQHERLVPRLDGRLRCLRCGAIVMHGERLPRCALRGYRIECRGGLQRHHCISKQMSRGNKAVRDVLRDCPDEIMAWVCEAHHIGKYVDNPQARAMLLSRNVELYGYDRVQRVVDGLPWKVPKPEWTLFRLLNGRGG